MSEVKKIATRGWHGKAPNDAEYEIAMADLEKVGEALCQK